MNSTRIIDLTPSNIEDYGVCGYKDTKKHKELRKKIEWFNEYYPRGLRIKALLAEDGTYQGMLEYIPGELAHRPVNADGYMFIHCIFMGFKKEYKGKGLASELIKACISDSKEKNMKGVAVVTRKGSFMAKKDIFLKMDFQLVDKAKPDFELLSLKFDNQAQDPHFKTDMNDGLEEYGQGLSILRSAQCPYTEKNVNAIIESAEKKYGMKARLIELKDAKEVQSSPCAFGTFCIIHDGKIISHHPISKTRFENIMR